MKTLIISFITCAFLTVLPYRVFSADLTTPKSEISETLYSHYQNQDIKYLNLSDTEDESFPHNIEITIESKLNSNADNVIFCFTQEFALNNLNLTDHIINEIKKQHLSFNSVILLTACDCTDLETEGPWKTLTGTSVYASRLENQENVSAIVFIETDKSSDYHIISGGNYDVSPRWMVKALTQACADSSYECKTSNNSILMYRNGLVKENDRVSSFLASGIPAAGIEINESTFSDQLFREILSELEANYTSKWDRHYSYINLFGFHFWPSEVFHVTVYISFVFVTLLSLTFMLFRKNRKNELIRKKIAGTWFFVPAAILLTWLTLQLSQLVIKHFTFSPIVLLGFKVLAVFAVTMIVYIIQIYFNFRISFQASGFYLTVIGALNLFVFSTLDLSVIFVFFQEFLLIYFCRISGRHKVPLMIFTLLLIVPFIPYLKGITSADPEKTLALMTQTPALINLLFSLVLFPFILEWSRIIQVFHAVERNENTKADKFISKAAVIILLSLAAITAIYSALAAVFLTNSIHEEKKSVSFTEDAGKSLFTTDYSATVFGELTMQKLKIRTKGNVNRLIVKASSTEGSPVYGSNFDYIYAGTDTIYFLLPDNPSGTIEINFRSDERREITFIIQAFDTSESENVLRQTDFLHIKDNSLLRK